MSSLALNILVAPLNWGLGHATRCVPVIDRYLAEGHRVTIGGDGESFAWLRRRYPDLPAVELAPLRLRYSSGRSQVLTMLCQIPHLIRWMIHDHRRLAALQMSHHFDVVVSDNRFALWLAPGRWNATTIYMTHQLRIPLPRGLRSFEGIAQRAHACIINRYARCWVPDEAASPGLAGLLSHPEQRGMYRIPIEYIGPLSRFRRVAEDEQRVAKEGAVLLLSGLEPQRSLLRTEFMRTYPHGEVIEGCTDDEYIARRLGSARTIVARSGYSTVMDLMAMGLLDDVATTIRWVPTPGQPEQEYLAALWGQKSDRVVI